MSIDGNGGSADASNAAARLRRERGWSRQRLAHEFATLARARGNLLAPNDSVIKQIYRVETGRTLIPQQPYVDLWCEVFGLDAEELLGCDVQPGVEEYEPGRFAVTSHKFVPTYIGVDEAARLSQRLAMSPAEGQWWAGCRTQQMTAAHCIATLYVWPWGVALIHLREELELETLTDLALWRRSTYPASRSWADELFREVTGDPQVCTPYCFSGYWLTRAKWRGEQLDRAVRLLSMPAQLLKRTDQDDDDATLRTSGLQVEQVMMRDGVERSDLVGFGASGVSVAYASWSSVAYHPLVDGSALPESELVACELLVQGIWCYTREILLQVESGREPVVPASYGWRFLRAVRSRLTVATPEETGQEHSMRVAVLETSKLAPQLDAALAALRDSEAGG